MSRAPGEGTTRHDRDHYVTPVGVIRPLADELRWHMPSGQGAPRILDCGAGTGVIAHTFRELIPGVEIVAIESDRTYEEQLRAMSGANVVRIEDYLGPEVLAYRADPFDLVVGNPPFSLWQPFAARSLELIKPDGFVALLGNMHVYGSETRGTWWRQHENDAQRVIYPRPSFTGGATDAVEYAWIMWQGIDRATTLRPFGHYYAPKPPRARRVKAIEAEAAT